MKTFTALIAEDVPHYFPRALPSERVGSAPRRRGAQSFCHSLLALILVTGQCPFIVRELRQKSKPSDTIGSADLRWL
jgi:hypothetical protein